MLASSQEIPLVEEHLSALQQLQSFTDSRLQVITTAMNGVDPLDESAVHAALYGALGPGGLGLFTAPGQLVVDADSVACSVSVDMSFQQVLANVQLPLNATFGVGMDALPIEIATTGGINIGLSFQEHVALAFSQAGPQFTADTMSLVVTAGVTPGSTFEAIVGFVPVTISDYGTPQQPTQLQASFSANNVLAANPTFGFLGTADLYLRAGARLGPDTDFQYPGISTDIEIHWSFDSDQPTLNPPTVQFQNVGLDLGTAISDLIRPVLETIQLVTMPGQPIIEVLKKPLPGLTDISHALGSGNVSIQSLIDEANQAGAFGEYKQLVSLISTGVDITNIINTIENGDSLRIVYGDFDLAGNGDLRTLPDALSTSQNPLIVGNLTQLVPNGLGDFDIAAVAERISDQLESIANNPNLPQDLRDAALKAKQIVDTWGNGITLKFPIIDNPLACAFRLLVGQDANLVEFKAQFVGDAYRTSGYRFGPVEIKYDGSIHVDGLYKVGYDTFGLRKLLFDPSHNPESLAEGFFIDNQTHLDVSGRLDATILVPEPYPLVEVGGQGSVSLEGANGFGYRLEDPTPADGKLRLSEADPNCFFKTRGKLEGSLGVFFKVGFEIDYLLDTVFVGVEKHFNIAKGTILDLTHGCAPLDDTAEPLELLAGDPATGLGNVAADGTLTLFMGPHAALRTGIWSDEDGAEDFIVEHVSGDPSLPEGETVSVVAFGVEHKIAGVRRIVAFGGNEADTIRIESLVASPAELHGGSGDDRLTYSGTSTAMLYGDEGLDKLTGGAQADFIAGGLGDDYLVGNGGNDVIHGNENNDLLFGGPGNDELLGQDGDDELDGDDGDDILTGGLGNDRLNAHEGNNQYLYGNEGNDSLHAASGRDFLFGGPENDVLVAGLGNDEVFGEAGDDVIFAEGGDDLVDGGSGRDRAEGGLGLDTIRGGTEDDLLFGNEARDVIDGHDGNDTIDAGDGDNDVYGGLGNDVITTGTGNDFVDGGSGDDSINTGDGNNTVYGQAGMDTIWTGLGNDYVDGGADSDTITTSEGDDTIYGRAGTDTIYSGAGDDYVEGNEDTDTIYAGSGTDYVDAGTGNDLVYAEDGDDVAIGGDGDDLIEGGGGLDVLLGDMGVVTSTVILTGGIGRDTIRGQDGDDRIYGQGGDDTLEGNAGQDTIFGHDGNDSVSGGTERDYLVAGAGNDTVFGNEADDLIEGGAGDDLIEGGLGADRIYGDDGNDTIYGFSVAGVSDNAPEIVFAGAGNDLVYGSGGADELDGGPGIDILHGLAGNDLIVAGTGIGDELYGGDGDDRLQGSDEGADTDPDFNDTTRFGDWLEGGPGNDTIYGLGGADAIRGGDGADWVHTGTGGDRVWAGSGNDYVYAGRGTGDTIDGEDGDDVVYGSHEGNDWITGGSGRDQLYGQGGNDSLSGDDDDDQLDGGVGTDIVLGGAGNDTLYAGGGVGDSLDGGAGSDVLHGSDDGADSLVGGAGRDTIYGKGGNDSIAGGDGDDLIEGGAGDDTISGDGGSDLIVGGANHDTLYGHSVSGAGDDNAVDFLYGDFGTNRDEPGSGRDQLFGQGGNDLAFGEADDDFIDAGAGTSDIVNYGSGEGPDPANFVPPAPTPPPDVQPGVGITLAQPTLATLADTRGFWSELGGSGEGVSQSPAAGIEPSIAIDNDRNRYLAWVDARQGNYEIYVARHVAGVGWQGLPVLTTGSASDGGVSNSDGSSRRPSLAIGADGNPIVAWTEYTGPASDIRVASFDPSAAGGQGAWVALGTSLGTTGISATGTADSPIVLTTTGGVTVAWLDSSGGVTNVYVKRFDGSTWSGLGGAQFASGSGVSQSTSSVTHLAAATDGTKVSVTWTQPVAGGTQVYLKEFAGSTWNAVGNSASGNGVSNLTWENQTPSVAYHGGELFVAWQSSTQQRPEVHVRRFDGGQWQLAGGSADFGVSATMGRASQPRLASRGGKMSLAWADDARARFDGEFVSVFAMNWDGNQFTADFQRELRDPGLGTTVTVASLSLALDATGRPLIGWSETGDHGPQVFVRGNFFDASGTRYQAGPMQSIQAILDANDLNPGDVIEVVGDSPGFTLTGQDSGLMIVGTPGATITGPITLDSASDVTLQALRVNGSITINGGARNSVLQSSFPGIWSTGSTDLQIVGNQLDCDGVTLEGAVRPVIERNQVTASITGVVFSGAASSDVLVRQNSLTATNGIEILVASTGVIANNEVIAIATGLDIQFAFTGSIRENEIRGAATGIRYAAAAALDANRVHHNTTGIVATVNDPATGLGFADPTARPNEIHDNTTGVQLTGVMQGQYIHHNVTGVAGSGSLVAADFDHGNLIEFNQTGVDLNGPVQFNKIGSNATGLNAYSGQLIAHNSFYRNTTTGVNISGRTDVRFVSNTLYSPAGDLVRVVQSSRDVQVTGNVMWAETGTVLYVANDSQQGFWSDYNLLHAGDTGRLVHWSNFNFTDILDWQADVAQFDLHSRGRTVVDPTWSEPLFVNRAMDDYQLPSQLAGQRRSSPSVDAGHPLSDLALAATYPSNLLTNPSFESGTTGWNVHPGGTTASGPLPVFDGTMYFASGNSAAGFSEQTIDLLANGFTTAQLDSQDFIATFGGRVRTVAESLRDSATITLKFFNSADQLITQVTTPSSSEVDRWSLVGDRVRIPVGTRKLGYRFDSTRASGTSNDAALDHAFVRVHSDRIAPDLGATGNTYLDVPSSGAPQIALRSPDLYTDWERGESQSIRWESYGNTAHVPVRIDLYQDGPHGPAFVTTIAASTADDGEFTWAPENSSIAFGTHGLRFHVQLVGDEIVLDRGTEPYSVPENTTTFFVNDRVTTDDQHTASIGSNRNTGKLASAPKPYPNNVLRIYALGPTHSLSVDTGDYPIFQSLLIANSAGLGDDEGFVMTGPTIAGRTATLRHANPLYTSAPVMELFNADSMTMSYLTAEGGTNGLWVHGGSESFVGHHLATNHASSHGLLLDTTLANSTLDFITSTANGGYGIYVPGPIPRIFDSEVAFNATGGIYLANPGTVQLEANYVHDNLGYGMLVAGGPPTIGNANLALERGNRVASNAGTGIHVVNVGATIVGNTVTGHRTAGATGIYSAGTISNNVVSDNTIGIGGHSVGTTVTGNRAYNNGVGITLAHAGSVSANVVYSNGTGIELFGAGTNANNLAYANASYGIGVRSNNVQLINNSLYAHSGEAINVGTALSNLTLRNNLVWAAGTNARGIVVPTNSQSGFQSDYNLWHTTGGGKVGQWQGIDRATFAAWQNATFTDQNSLAQDPLLVDIDGADDVLGYTPVNTGFDDDFHVQSLYGSFHGGSLAPVLNPVTGLPVFPTATLTVDAAQSPAIDRGAASDPFGNEPAANGGFVNLGSYGNTAQASLSPTEYITVMRPDGGEIWPAGQSFAIRWRSHDFVGDAKLELLDSVGSVHTTIAATTPNDGEFTWAIPTGQTPGNYSIRVTRLDAGMQSDTSNGLFLVPAPVAVYYVNDGLFEPGDWTTAAGDDANDGRSPGAPKATLQNLLNAYDFGPGDTIRVDSGTYDLTANIQIAPDDSGVVIEGYHDSAFPTRKAAINRGNTSSGSFVIQFTGADDVTLDHLHLTGAYWGVMAAAGVDSDRIRITNCEIFGNQFGGISMDTSNEFQQITGNLIYNSPSTGAAGIQLLSTSGATVNENTVHTIYTGIYLQGAFSQSTANLISGNHVYANTVGITPISSTGNYPTVTVQGNDVHNNSSHGINSIWANVAIIGNSVHHNPSFGIRGLDVRDNDVFDNGTGIAMSGSDRASGNRVYRNQVGIATGFASIAEANTVYSNATGIEITYNAVARQNLVYDNTTRGIRVWSSSGGRVENNTIHEPSASQAVRIESASSNITLKNNILSFASGYGIDVANDSQNGFVSDYNTLHLTGTGKVGRWQNRDFTSLTDWYYELGLDQHSQAADPQFVNPAGADGILGGVNGLDDDFHVTTTSPTIDAGDPIDGFSNEPNPHGGRINQGHTGNRVDATISPAQFAQVLAPNGLEKLEHNQQVDIRWRTFGIPEPGGTYLDAVLGQTPVAYYRLGEKSGTTATDASRNGRHGTYANVGSGLTLGVPGSMAAESDTAISVVSPGSVSVPDSAALRPSQITLEAWINPDLTIASNSAALMKTTSSSWNDGYGMVWLSDKLRFFVNNYNGAGKVEATITKGQWSHVVGTYDSGALKIYVNGTEVASTSYAVPITHATQPLYIGSSFGSWNWKGKLDEVAVYSGALSAAQVAQHYSKGTRPVYGSADIELLAPGNPTPVLTIAQTTPNDGQFTWTVPASVAEGDYLIRVRANEGIQPSAASSATFQVANAGSHYYVNDNSLTGDLFTTVVGNNAFTGKRPDQPMSSLAALLAAYDLDSGDVIHVDAGTYNLVANVKLAAQDNGVRIEGPGAVATGVPPVALLNRGNTSFGNSALQFSGADDVTIDYLTITGGYYGISVDYSTDSDRLTLTNNEVYGNTWRGIYLGPDNDDIRVEGNRLHDNGQYGFLAEFVAGLAVRNNDVFNHTITGIQVTTTSLPGGNSLIADNDVHNNAIGILVSASRHVDVLDNRVYANTSGINAVNDVLISGNDVYSNVGGYGILANLAVVDGNTIYGNKRGIEASQSPIRNNRIYANLDEGILLDLGGSGVGQNVVERNALYDNEVGIHVGSSDNVIRNNLIYDNFGGGVWVRTATNLLIDGNTIYQPATGDAVQVGGPNPVSFLAAFGGRNVTVRNNILWAEQAYGIRMSPDSERGFASDYNNFHTTGTGKLGRWEDRDFTDRADWFFETGNDQHSVVGDPQLVDADGPDNILGYDTATSTDGGLDDDFRVLASSPTIDRGDPLGAFAGEPTPNGGRLNIGSTGNTADAATSAPQVVHLLSPNGLEKFEVGQLVTISWQVDGLTPGATVDLEYSADNGATWTPIADDVGMDPLGHGSYLWNPTAETNGNTALVRVLASQGAQPQDTSDGTFLVTNGGSDYYVNDNSQTDDVFTTAVGDNLASGKNPDQPMASLPALLAAYDLDPGDVVHVDSGTYRLYRGALLAAQDSGVQIEGPGAVAEGQATGAIATLNRGNTSTGQYVVELAGVDDATVEHLSITGGVWGVYARNASGSDRVTLSHNDIFGNNGNPNSLAHGINIDFGNNDTRIVNNRIHNNSGVSISRGIYTVGPRTLLEENEVYGHSYGIESYYPGSNNPADAAVIRGNIVRDNTTFGIRGYTNDQVINNTVFGHTAFTAFGIFDWGGVVRDNVVYGNYDGIVTNSGGGSQLIGNRVFNNSHYGVLAYATSQVNANQVYSNSVGLFLQSFSGTLANNLVYANTNQGVVIQTGDGPSVVNNTIYHPVGDAVRMQASTRNVKFHNNIVWVDSGYDIYVDSSSQTGLASDRNLLHQSADPNAYVGFWGGANRDTLADWQAATGQDADSVAADPLFVDRNGSDNVLGYRTRDGFDGGRDDNFHLLGGSPAIDRGDGTFGPTLDRDGYPRVDDPGTVNAGIPAGLSYVDLGAHEFQGSSLDTLPPTVVSSSVETIAGNPSTTQVRVVFSEPIDPIDALSASNYELRSAGPNGLFDDGDDTLYTLVPNYIAGSTEVLLAVLVPDGILPDGSYRFRVSGDTSIHDVSGNKLDGDANGTAGGDFVGINSPPQLPTIGDLTVDEGQTVSFSAAATDPNPGSTLTYSLAAGAPAGAAIDPTTGLFTWTPGEEFGPSEVTVTIVVTDDGTPVMPDLATFSITVLEVNTPPVLATIADQDVMEGTTITFSVTATDGDVPANQLTFSLESGAPEGATIDPVTGLFSWTPTEAQGPGAYDVTVKVTDDGSPSLSGTATFRVTVGEVNSAPVLNPIPDRTVAQNQLLLFPVVATDPDLPVNTLTYSLEPGAPEGAQIDPSTGVFLWTPPSSVVPGDYPITVRVTDDGVPALFHTQSFVVTVLPDPTINGDFNDDGLYNALDIDALVAQIAAGTHDPAYDLTHDGLVDLADRDAWLAEAGSVNLGAGRVYLLGDANLDGFVDGQDFIRWNNNKFQSVAAWSAGDFTADGFVDGQDFIQWNNNKFTSADAPRPPERTRMAHEYRRGQSIERDVDSIFASWNGHYPGT
jgi:parallel beta-helix repeat protein